MRISLVMAVYNAAWCVERALDSVFAQTRVPDEIFVCDDGSTDGTADLIERRYGDRVTLMRLPHRNASATRVSGLERATGDWFAFMDADDSWVPDKIERQLAFLARHPEVRMVSSDGVYADAEGAIRTSWLSDYFDPVRTMVGDMFPMMIERCFVLVSSTMVEREAYRSVGGMDPAIVYSHDYDLWLKLTARYPTAVMEDRLITYFSSPGALSKRYEARHRDDLALLYAIAGGAFPGRPSERRRAAARAAALEFDVALLDLRAGRAHEARGRFRKALGTGPWRRRLAALIGVLAPPGVLQALARAAWVKTSIAGAREASSRIPAGSLGGGA